MKPLLVGEASNLPDGRAFGGRSGLRLASLCGLALEEFLDAVEAVNLLDRWPGRSGGEKGHLFPAAEARAAADRLDVVSRRVVLCGLRVAAAFGLRRPTFLAPAILGRNEASCVVLPHPSGIVRWYNSEANREAAGKALRRMLRRCRAGGGT